LTFGSFCVIKSSLKCFGIARANHQQELGMKCPKCGYISFDYNQACPKCKKDVSTVQEKLNIPDFKPDPPNLLGALFGPREPEAHLNASGEIPVIHQETEISLGDSSSPSDGAALGDSQELDLSLELDGDLEADHASAAEAEK
jgi:hypothetical protein